jgi:hypothetical protein
MDTSPELRTLWSGTNGKTGKPAIGREMPLAQTGDGRAGIAIVNDIFALCAGTKPQAERYED